LRSSRAMLPTTFARFSITLSAASLSHRRSAAPSSRSALARLEYFGPRKGELRPMRDHGLGGVPEELLEIFDAARPFNRGNNADAHPLVVPSDRSKCLPEEDGTDAITEPSFDVQVRSDIGDPHELDTGARDRDGMKEQPGLI
jgi:hypothetical protein